jgi:DedD protein
VKERLTGAIILVALIVLLVPELLTGPIRAKPAPAETSISASAPGALPGEAAAAKAPLRTYTLTLGSTPPGQQALATPAVQARPAKGPAQGPSDGSAQGHAEGSTEGGSAPPSAESKPQGAHPRATSSVPPPRGRARPRLQVAKSSAHRPVRETRSSGSSGGWVVQLGSFAGHRNADRLAHSLRARGFRISVSPARAGSRVLWRVRAGPVSDRTSAGRLAARLRSLGHSGEILPSQ